MKKAGTFMPAFFPCLAEALVRHQREEAIAASHQRLDVFALKYLRSWSTDRNAGSNSEAGQRRRLPAPLTWPALHDERGRAGTLMALQACLNVVSKTQLDSPGIQIRNELNQRLMCNQGA